MTLRIAVIGAGIMGGDHARIIAGDLPGASLHVICDAAQARAAAISAECGGEVATNPVEVINRSDVDAVVIASPDATHAPLVLACIAAGKPVLCEKPLSQSPAECHQVTGAEVAAGRQFVQIGFMRRFDASYAEMKAALADGVIGRALMMHNFHRNVETPAADFTAAMAITNSAPHEFDITRWVLGCDFVSVTAFKPSRSGPLVGPVFLVLETTAGQLVNIEVNNNAAYGYDVRGELVGEKGAISLARTSPTRRDLALIQSTSYPTDWRPAYAEAYRQQNKAWVRSIQTGNPSDIAANAWDGLCAAVVAEAGVQALTAGHRIAVTLPEKPALYR